MASTMNTHPHGEHLSAYLDAMLDVAQMRQVAAHLSACASCRAALESMQETRTLLRAMPPLSVPAPEFWTNAYRRLRVAERERALRPSSPLETLRAGWQSAHRRWAAGVAAAALLGAAIVAPVVNHALQPTDTSALPAAASLTADAVDLPSLVRAHTQSAARQPLADPDRQDMIAADVDDMAAFSDSEAAGNGTTLAGDAAP